VTQPAHSTARLTWRLALAALCASVAIGACAATSSQAATSPNSILRQPQRHPSAPSVKAASPSGVAPTGGTSAPGTGTPRTSTPRTGSTPTTRYTPPTTTYTPPTATVAPTASTPATAAPRTATVPPTATTAAKPAKSGRSKGLTSAEIALAALAALLALCALAWGAARMQAYEPRWSQSLRHALAEGGFRVSATWAEFADWVRLGR
jgi:hypothetical protein